MKAAVLTLAVLFFTGSQARYLWQGDEPAETKTYWEEIKDLLPTYADSIKESSRDYLTSLDTSTIGQKLNLKLLENFDIFTDAIRKAHSQIQPIAQEFWNNLEKETQGLRQTVDKDLELVKAKVQPYLDTFQKNVEQELAAYRMKLEPLSIQWRTQAQEKAQEVQQKVAELGEHALNQVRNHVDKLRVEVAPYGEEAQKMVAEQIQKMKEQTGDLGELHTKVVDQLKALGQKSQPALMDLQHGLLPMWENLKSGVTTMVEEIGKNLENPQ